MVSSWVGLRLSIAFSWRLITEKLVENWVGLRLSIAFSWRLIIEKFVENWQSRISRATEDSGFKLVFQIPCCFLNGMLQILRVMNIKCSNTFIWRSKECGARVKRVRTKR